jgi:thiamine kinase-like enzyme
MDADELSPDAGAALRGVLWRIPELAGRDLSLHPLSGGITNRNYLVTARGVVERHVLRIAGNDTNLLGINREVEHAATVAAASVGVGPQVTAFLRPEGYLVTRFIDGVPIPEAGARHPETLARLAASLRRIHTGPLVPGLFMPLRIAELYGAMAQERGVVIPVVYERAREVGRRVERACVTSPEEMRPCHNDLLPGNLIDDGTLIRIVDWEYAGMGDPFFDLGNLSVNNDFTPDEDAALLDSYDPDGVQPVRLARLTLMRVVSDFREAMWGVLQQAISTLDVDFASYANGHFDRLLSNATTPAFERALRLVTEGDPRR